MSKIITAGTPDLKRKALPVTAFDKKLKFIISDMKKTLYEANGVGLAAPQIDLNIRVFVADDGESGFEAYVNPVWEPVGNETNVDTEGCKKKQKVATGLLARCIQHETDHLNGILFIEKATALRRLEE
ncbi:peptide deformylase [Allisonella histaminiformans]|uniref:peptide deformylase n=1 Tax=Allisonella histaminiformans TaxID=209880 RepID=UPI00307F994F